MASTIPHWRNALTRRWLRWRESLIFGLLEGLPFAVGQTLRRWVYRAVLAQIGRGAIIRQWVEFDGASRIKIGDQVSLRRYVRLRNLTSSKYEIRLGDRVSLDYGVEIKAHGKGHIDIGYHTYIGPYSCLSGSNLKIGKNCLIASHAGIYANNHNFDDPASLIRKQGNSYKGIVIEDNCWLGSGVRVLDGITIGQGSVIGAGAVVTKNIPPYSIAVGVPAKVVGHRDPSFALAPQVEVEADAIDQQIIDQVVMVSSS